MTVQPCIIHSWDHPDVVTDTIVHPTWAATSFYPFLEDSISQSEGELANAAATGISYANQINTILANYDSVPHRTAGMYSIYVHGFADRDAMRGHDHPDDAITAWNTDYPGDTGTQGPFTANGRAESKLWGDAFLTAFKGRLDELSLPYPQRFHMDSEFIIGHFDATKSASLDYPGWMDYAYSDPRAKTELVNGVDTFKDLVDNWVTADGGALTWDAEQSYWLEVNRNLRDFMSYLNLVIRDYILHDGLLNRAKELFPGMLTSNWEHSNFGTNTMPSISNTKASGRLFGNSALYSDFAAPTPYPLSNVSFQDTGSEKPDWVNTLGITLPHAGPPYDDNYAMIFTEAGIQQIETVVANEGAANVAPWINFAEQTFSVPNFVEGMQLVTINSVDADNFAIGNTIEVMNSSSTVIYTGTIERVYDEGDGTHTINVSGTTPDDSGANYGNIDTAIDTTINVESGASAMADESTSFIYSTRNEDIQKILRRCIDFGITEYIFWQNPALMNDTRWSLIADNVEYLEDGLGVRRGQASASINSSGTIITVCFDEPANGSWDLTDMTIDNTKKPQIIVGKGEVTYTDIDINDFSIVADGKLSVNLVLVDRVVTAGETVNLIMTESWGLEAATKFKTAATDNVMAGVGANPSTGFIQAQNNSAISYERGENSWGIVADRISIPKFVPENLRNSVVLTRRGWEQRLSGSNIDKGQMEVIVAGNFGRATSENDVPRVFDGVNNTSRTLHGFIDTPIEPYFIEIQDPNKVIGSDSVGISMATGLPAGITIGKEPIDSPMEVFRISGTPTDRGIGTMTIIFSDTADNEVVTNIGYNITRDFDINLNRSNSGPGYQGVESEPQGID